MSLRKLTVSESGAISLHNYSWYVVGLVVLVAAATVVAQQQQDSPDTVILGGGAPPRPSQKDLLYVVAAGGAVNDLRYGGEGVLVFDASDYHVIKRLDLPKDENPAWQGNDRVDAISANAATARLYVARSREMYAYDLLTDKLIWQAPYGGRIAVTPDGSKIYAPGGGGDRNSWAVVEAKTGKLVTTIKTEKTVGPHNTIVTLDGSRVFMSGVLSRYVSVADTATNKVIGTVGPFSHQNRVYTINGAGTLIYVTMVDLLGFEVGDVKTGKVLHRVEVPGYGSSRERVITHGTPSHGVAMSPDEKEVWVLDAVNGGLLHVFDNTVMPPKYKQSIKLRIEEPGWVSWSMDGKLVYPASGDVIDAATKRVISGLFDEVRPESGQRGDGGCSFLDDPEEAHSVGEFVWHRPCPPAGDDKRVLIRSSRKTAPR